MVHIIMVNVEPAYFPHLLVQMNGRIIIMHCWRIELYSYLQMFTFNPDKFLTTENIMDVVKDVEEFWDSLGRQLGVRQTERDSIRNLHQNDHQKMEAMLDHYVTCYPVPSWKRFAATIQGMGFSNLADVVTVRYVTGSMLNS